MTILVNLDLMLVRRKVSSRKLAAAIGLSETNLSLIKSGKIRGVRFTTLDAICAYLECQPGDILSHEANDLSHEANDLSHEANDDAGERRRRPNHEHQSGQS